MDKRDKSIDVLKGIGIILVVIGHMNALPIGYSIVTYIYTFHMPLFFWITGYLSYSSKERPFLENLKRKAKSILLPYFVLFCVSLFYGHVILQYVFGETIVPFNLRATVKAFFFSSEWLNTVPVFNFPLWYLPLLFIAVIIFYFIQKIKDIRLFILVAVILSILTFPIQQLAPGRPILHINVLPAALFFMCLGHIYKHFEDRIKIHNLFLIPMFGFTLWFAYKYAGNIAVIPHYFYFISAAFSIYIYFKVAKDLSSSNVLSFLGSASLIIFGVHALVNNTYRFTPFEKYFVYWSGLAVFLINLLYIIIGSAAIYFAFEFVKKKFFAKKPLPAT